MKIIFFLVSITLGATGYAQQVMPTSTSADSQKVSTVFGPSAIAPIGMDDLALYPGKKDNFTMLPEKNLGATYHYKGRDYYVQPSKTGYFMRSLEKDPSPSVMKLEAVGHGEGFLFINDKGTTAYADFDQKHNLIIEYYDPKTKKVIQLKIEPKIN